jgi:cyclopropane fatty-acyl-phospholipid synthase-like methyltransferase
MSASLSSQYPQDKDWNNFWKASGSQKFSQESWSKKRMKQILLPLVGAGKKVLDAGCGSGYFSAYFCDQGMDVVSVDYAESSLTITKQITLGRARIMKADLLKDKLSDCIAERFDVIFSDGLFEHFTEEDQNKIFKNLLSIMQPVGNIITFVPNQWSPWQILRPFLMPGISETPFILEKLKLLNERNGLRVIQSGGVNVLPFSFSPERIFGKRFGMLLYAIGSYA